MGKRKKRKCSSDLRVEFLIEKGKEFSADLIKKATKWEIDFKKKLECTKIPFIFQFPIVCNKRNLFILDFYIPKYKLAIELDGAGHYTPEGMKSDKRRTACLKREGIRVARIMNMQVVEFTSEHIKELISFYE